MRTRSKAREAALQTLYELDLMGGDINKIIEKVKDGLEINNSGKEFYESLVRGSRDNINEIDRLIEELSENWSISRMAVVDRNILRLAMFELRQCTETPYKVIINESIELAKRFGSEDSGAFVNGILDRVAHKAGIKQV
ncbi:MAG: transcription antitermination factor NusB [Thermodesulfobacteriota bacterium]